MLTQNFKTESGLEVVVNTTELNCDSALAEIFTGIDTHRGALFSSGFEYPGRHSRWDIGFINPALEFVSHGREFSLNGLNAQGRAILGIFHQALSENQDLAQLALKPSSITGTIKTPEGFFTEESRSKRPSIFSVIRSILSVLRSAHPAASNLGLYGAFGYDLIYQFEEIQTRLPRDRSQADCHLFLPLEIRVVDRKREVAMNISYGFQIEGQLSSSLSGGGVELLPIPSTADKKLSCDHQPGEFAEKVRKVIEGTRRGDYFEVVLSQTFSAPFSETPTQLFNRLARINPSPYMFLLNFGSEQLVGASPELFVRVTGTRYETCPIAGTVRRGENAIEDADRVRELLSSKKDESELTMCTDVDRNDMARVCIPGSVKVIGRRQLEFYSHLIHTVDHLEGTLAPEFDGLDALQTHMWACTVTGAPKPAAIQEIENLENSPRRWYSGAIGFVSAQGDVNTGITLRTAHIKDGIATLRSGATLLFESDPELEEEETRIKAGAFLQSLIDAGQTPAKPLEAKPASTILPTQSGLGKRVLLVDYQDSFVHNLASYLRELGAEVTTVRHDFPRKLLREIDPSLVLLSPGPGSPEEFHMSDLISEIIELKIPIFGVCLGHQGIGQHFGGTLGVLGTPCHGKPGIVHHNGDSILRGLESPFEAGRYHSLYITTETLPPELKCIAQTEDGVIMAIKHKTLPIYGVQFHPESLMSLKKSAGHTILSNLLAEI